MASLHQVEQRHLLVILVLDRKNFFCIPNIFLTDACAVTLNPVELNKRVIDLPSPSEIVKQITSINIEPGVEVKCHLISMISCNSTLCFPDLMGKSNFSCCKNNLISIH